MDDFFAGGHVAVMLLALLAAEATVLLMLWWWRGSGVPPGPLLAFLGSGACMALALRAALAGQTQWCAIWLTAALPPHVAWLVLAWRSR